MHEESLSIQCARAHLPRIERLLVSGILEDPEVRQLLAAKSAMENPELLTCTGLDKMIRCLDSLEDRLRRKLLKSTW